MNENDIATIVIGKAMEVHSELGPGLLESTYRECLSYALSKSGLFVAKEKAIPLIYNEVKLDSGFRADLLIENKLIVEIKSIEALNEIHLAQTLTYLRLGQYKLGLLMNFNVVHMKEGVKSVINGRI